MSIKNKKLNIVFALVLGGVLITQGVSAQVYYPSQQSISNTQPVFYYYLKPDGSLGYTQDYGSGAVNTTGGNVYGSSRVVVGKKTVTNTSVNNSNSVTTSPVNTQQTNASTASTNNSSSVSVLTPSSFFSRLANRNKDKEEEINKASFTISNIQVVTGPKNLETQGSELTCSVNVSWSTSENTVGQVLYGRTSQSDLNNLKYEAMAPVGNNPSNSHSTNLGCLENGTYYFRVVAFSEEGRVVSEEKVMVPFKVDTRVISTFEGDATASASRNISLTAITLPIVILLLLALITFAYLRRKNPKDNELFQEKGVDDFLLTIPEINGLKKENSVLPKGLEIADA